MEKLGLTHRVDEAHDRMPFPRLWAGRNRSDPGALDLSVDSGLCLEWVPTASWTALHAEEMASHAGLVLALGGGDMLRIDARTFLVTDLDDTIKTLQRNFDWAPDKTGESESGKWARYGFSNPSSAVLEVLQPNGSSHSRETSVLAEFGNGPYGMRIVVNGIEEKAASLAEAGTPVELLTTKRYGDVVRPNPDATLGTAFEFVDVSACV
jgi:hypothetical protein